MHYCQECRAPNVMIPDERGAVCPVCGHVDPVAVRQPFFVVVGASGAGKSTILPHLLAELAGVAIVFDADWLIDPLAGERGIAGVDWTAFRDAWLHVAHGVAQNGFPTVLLGPLIPEHLDELPGRRWVTDIHYIVLDCPDDERRRRIESRPPWRSRDIEDQVAFGRWLREHLPDVVDTSSGSPADAAHEVATIIRQHLRG
jgi:predicted ABC-type ATPase